MTPELLDKLDATFAEMDERSGSVLPWVKVTRELISDYRAATDQNAQKVAVCEYLLRVNREHDGPFIPPTAIDWLGDGIVNTLAAVISPKEET